MSKGSVNKVILIGRLGADPEVRYTPSEAAVANISLATNYSTKKGDDWIEQTEWVNVVAWNRLAEIVKEYAVKGSRIYVEGRLQTRSWEDSEGNKRYSTEVVANDLQLLDSKGEAQQAPAQTFKAPTGYDENNPDDVPF